LKKRRLGIKVVSPQKEKEVLVVPNASKPSPALQTMHPKKKERKKGKLQKK